MKLEFLYCKEQLEDDAKVLASIKTARSLMTAGELEAERRAGIDRFQEIWAQYQSRRGHYSDQAFKIYQRLIDETKPIAHDYGLDMTAEWSEKSGWIELVCGILLADSTANPLHLQLGCLFERCDSYSFMPTQRYGRNMVALTFHFSFISYLAEEDESSWE